MNADQPILVPVLGDQLTRDLASLRGRTMEGLEVPQRPLFEPDETTRDVITLVEEKFGDYVRNPESSTGLSHVTKQKKPSTPSSRSACRNLATTRMRWCSDRMICSTPNSRPASISACSIRSRLDNAHAHHIQRPMVLGNVVLIAGNNPGELQDWYLDSAEAYLDTLKPAKDGLAR